MELEEESEEVQRERRRVFRLRLPDGSALSATINGVNYKVLEVSELSLLLETSGVCNRNGICKGTIHWSKDENSEFTGEVGRLVNSCLVIDNVVGITMSHMVKQQRFVITRYPSVRQFKKTS